jgi:hypothetical protein
MKTSWILISGISVVAWCTICGALALSLHHQMLQRLRGHHHVLWLDLGAPTLWSAIAARSPWFSSSGSLTYQGWIRLKSFRLIDDDQAAEIGEHLRRLGWSFFALFFPLLVLVIWLARGN